jgi:hypothetical protein
MRLRIRTWKEVRVGLPYILLGMAQLMIFTWVVLEKPELTTIIAFIVSLGAYFFFFYEAHRVMDEQIEEQE